MKSHKYRAAIAGVMAATAMALGSGVAAADTVPPSQQNAIDKVHSTLSNVLKKFTDTAAGIVQNIK